MISVRCEPHTCTVLLRGLSPCSEELLCHFTAQSPDTTCLLDQIDHLASSTKLSWEYEFDHQYLFLSQSRQVEVCRREVSMSLYSVLSSSSVFIKPKHHPVAMMLGDSRTSSCWWYIAANWNLIKILYKNSICSPFSGFKDKSLRQFFKTTKTFFCCFFSCVLNWVIVQW